MSDAGSSAAEFAIVLPAIMLIVIVGVSATAAQAQRVLLQDAVADAARLIARGDDAERADALIAEAVPGATMSIGAESDLVCVTASVPVAIVPTISVTVSARACALGGGL